jgi:hypothetical protein
LVSFCVLRDASNTTKCVAFPASAFSLRVIAIGVEMPILLLLRADHVIE